MEAVPREFVPVDFADAFIRVHPWHPCSNWMRSRLAGRGCESGDVCRRVLSDESWIFEQVGGANGDELVSPVSIATSVAAHPRRSPFSFGSEAMKHSNLPLSSILVLAAWLHPLLTIGQSAVPDGFRIVDERGQVRTTKPIVQQINREVASTNRTAYIQHYVRMLSSQEATNRMFAIYALGNFQSPNSLEALFAQAKSETNRQVVCLLAHSVHGLFPYWPGADEDSEDWDCQAALKRWAQYYERHGYIKMFEVKYAEVKGNLEAEAMFVIGFAADTPSPDLLPFYQRVLKQTSFPKIRNACREAIDSLSRRK